MKPTVPATPHPRPSASRIPHASMPLQTEHASHSKTPIIVGAVLGVLLAVLAFVATARCIVRRLRSDSPITLGTPQPAEKFVDHFQDPPRSKSIFEFKFKPSASNENVRPNRLSNESWVTRETSPHSTLKRSTPPPPLPQILGRQDLDFRSYGFPGKRRLVPVTTPVCTPSDVTVFGSRVELATEKGKEEHGGDANGHGQGEQRHFIRPGEIYVPLTLAHALTHTVHRGPHSHVPNQFERRHDREPQTERQSSFSPPRLILPRHPRNLFP
ncbi:hypothetical protein PAXINDRAFT_98794 [Paxillus involutus ATCC 200175]|nr:hypothetical protein PAXINDRAFT_98794 [Paxillus involutus ATCC 200175]